MTCTVQSTFLTGPGADRPRDRRQRLVLPRPRRGLPLAPAQPARAGREGLGDGAAGQARLPRRERLLVVRDGRDDRLHGHAAPDLPRRRAQVARLLHRPAGAARPPDRAARRVPAVHVLGPDGGHRVVALDRGGGARMLLDAEDARPADGLPAAPRLRPPALRPGRARVAPRRRASSTTVAGDAGRARARARRHRRRAVRVRHHGRAPAGRRQPRAAPRRAAERPHAGRDGVPRPVDVARVRGRRPPDRARLRARPGRPRRGARSAAPGCPGSTCVLDGDDRRAAGLGHERAGELVLVAEPRRLVHLLLLARRRARARLRQAGRDPPQARLRPRRAVHGSRRPARRRRARAPRWCARRSGCAT